MADGCIASAVQYPPTTKLAAVRRDLRRYHRSRAYSIDDVLLLWRAAPHEERAAEMDHEKRPSGPSATLSPCEARGEGTALGVLRNIESPPQASALRRQEVALAQ